MVTMTGIQEPRVMWVPEYTSSLGAEAIELAESAGLKPDPWQALVIENALGRRDDGKWASFEIGVDVSRQNGKGGLLEIRELAGLFLIRERLQIHSAHQFDTSLEAFRRLLMLIEDAPDLDKEVKRVSRSHGEEGIELKGGYRIRFRTRTKGGGRGFTSDCLYLDEAMMIDEFSHGALLPTLSARPNPQVWYTGSAVDQMVHENGVVFARVRERGLAGQDPSLAYFEWSVDDKNEDGESILPDQVPEELLNDQGAWARANPGLGIRISPEHVEHELRSMDERTFAVERLGIGDWPITDKSLLTVIDMDIWDALTDEQSKPLDPVSFAFDVSPSRKSSAIGVAARRSDGLVHLEVTDHGPGTGWLVGRLAELREKHHPSAIICDGASPAASFVEELKRKGVKVETRTAAEYAAACGTFFDLVEQERIRHLGSPKLRVALRGAQQRPLGESWAWARKKSTVDISPLVAVTLALSGAVKDRSGGYIMDVSEFVEAA
jgi:hypothetical protein